jgi:hypothetical protein
MLQRCCRIGCGRVGVTHTGHRRATLPRGTNWPISRARQEAPRFARPASSRFFSRSADSRSPRGRRHPHRRRWCCLEGRRTTRGQRPSSRARRSLIPTLPHSQVRAVPGTAITMLGTSAPGTNRAVRTPASCRRSEGRGVACRSKPTHDQERAELSLLRAVVGLLLA